MSAHPTDLRGAMWRHHLLWPIVTLLLLLVINAGFNASFLHLEWRGGHVLRASGNLHAPAPASRY